MFQYGDGQTPLDEEETDGLRIKSIATRGELNEFEQQNIENALLWSLIRSFNPNDVFKEDFIKEIHKRMFKDVWNWAGVFRKTNKNIGVDKWRVQPELRQLLDDAKYWHEHTVYPPDELVIRLKHRLVSIHCFSNGNGRHSRLVADILIDKIYKRPVFTWGAVSITKQGEAIRTYLNALKMADNGDIFPLIAFSRA
ncbi:MAG: mobile mystery protein B [Bacteroidia bacterium]